MSKFQGSTAILDLGDRFYDPVEAAEFTSQGVRYFDAPLANSVGLELSAEQVETHFLDFEPLPGSLAQPHALRYHGHQFRHYNPDIGDGRGFLFARAAVLTRLSHSHIRFGTFQRQAFYNDREALERLCAYCIQHFYPDATSPEEMFDLAVTASADTVASWMAAGFVHGVMNTDNMNITGESFDYGPYRFLPTLDPGFTAAYFDHNGLYAYGRQPEAMSWNLAQLAQSLSLVCEDAPLIATLNDFAARYQTALNHHVFRRLGIAPKNPEIDGEFVRDTFVYLKDSQRPWPNFWQDWQGGAGRADTNQIGEYDGDWIAKLKAFDGVSDAPESDAPESLLYDEIGEIWQPIAEYNDWSAFEQKTVRLSTRP